MEQDKALLDWLKSLDIQSTNIQDQDLWKLLKIIDFEFFINSNNHVQRIKEWFMEKLNLQVQVTQDFTCLYSLLLVMAVQSGSNEFFIEKMQLLSVQTQMALKNIIQGVMGHVVTQEKRDDTLEMKVRELQLDLDEYNMKLHDKTIMVEKLSRQVQDYARLKQENENLGEKVQELEFLKEKYAKTEVLLQKYKKKMDDLQPLKELQETISIKNDEIYKLQEELRKDGLMKKMMASYKDQITKLETKNSGLQVQNKSLSDQVLELSKELVNVKESSQEQIKILQDRIIEISHQKMDQDDSDQETLDEVEKIQELNGKCSDFRKEIALLSDKILVLENQLDDMTRLKIAFEQDYRKTLETNSRVQKENVDLTAKLEKASDAASLSQKLQESQSMLQYTASINTEQSHTIRTMTQQLQSAQEECRVKHDQVNSLLQEKESLESRLNQLKERSNASDQRLAETKALLSAQESRNVSSNDVDIKLASATQKIVQLTDQNALLHQALRKAKNHILILDKTIKDEKSLKATHSDQNPYAEAIHSFETVLAEKQQEIGRLKKDLKDLQESTKKEEELMSAAWYNLCSTLQSSEVEKLAGDSPWLQLKRNDLL